MSKLEEIRGKIKKIDAVIASIENDEEILELEMTQEINAEEQAMNDSLPSLVICPLESKEMAQEILGFSDQKMENESVEIVGNSVEAAHNGSKYYPYILVKKTVYTQSKTSDRIIAESSDGRRGGGSYSHTSAGDSSIQEVWVPVSPNALKLKESALSVGAKYEEALKELEPLLEEKKKKIQGEYYPVLQELYDRKRKLKKLKSPLSREEYELRNELYYQEQAKALENLESTGWEDSPY